VLHETALAAYGSPCGSLCFIAVTRGERQAALSLFLRKARGGGGAYICGGADGMDVARLSSCALHIEENVL